MKLKIYKNFVLYLISSALLLSAFYFLNSHIAEAASLFLESQNNEFKSGTDFEVKFFINTENDSINAIQGKIKFPGELLKLKEIQDAGSIINFWIEKPKADGEEINFSGITPGGYENNRGLIFSLVFNSLKEGNSGIIVQNAKAFRNDGQGTEISPSLYSFNFSISKNATSSYIIPVSQDIIPPEVFKPIIGRNESMFDNKYFLVFSTEDKQSGIDHYEVRETSEYLSFKIPQWVRTESPYVLQDQSLKSVIDVKAVDKAGNERIVRLPPQNRLKWYENYLFWGIILCIAAVAIIRFLKNKKKNTK